MADPGSASMFTIILMFPSILFSMNVFKEPEKWNNDETIFGSKLAGVILFGYTCLLIQAYKYFPQSAIKNIYRMSILFQFMLIGLFLQYSGQYFRQTQYLMFMSSFVCMLGKDVYYGFIAPHLSKTKEISIAAEGHMPTTAN